MAIGCIISKEFPSWGRIGINYLGVLDRAENVTLQYEYIFRSLVNILPKIGLGYISDKYNYRDTGYWSGSGKTKKVENSGMLLGISLEKYLSSVYYIKIGYDGYLNFHKAREKSKNGAILFSLGFRIF
jgi:hypothetical protein